MIEVVIFDLQDEEIEWVFYISRELSSVETDNVKQLCSLRHLPFSISDTLIRMIIEEYLETLDICIDSPHYVKQILEFG